VLLAPVEPVICIKDTCPQPQTVTRQTQPWPIPKSESTIGKQLGVKKSTVGAIVRKWKTTDNLSMGLHTRSHPVGSK